MKTMTPRERMLTALARKEPDVAPVDIGGVRSTTIHIDGYRKLRSHLGLPPVEPRISERMMQVVQLDEDAAQALGVDTRMVVPGTPDNTRDHMIDERTWQDDWGLIRTKPVGAVWFDLAGSPLSGEITVQDILRYQWPDPNDPGRYRGLRDRVLAAKETDYAVIMNLPNACVHVSQYLRGFEEWYMDAAADPDLFAAMLDAVLEVNMTIASKILDEVGDIIDIAATSDDLGTQGGLQVSPPFFRKVIKPRLQKFFDAIHSRTKAPVFFHTCGSVYDIIGDLIDVGVDALNPIQVTAAKMEPANLKREFGEHVSFWGAIDTQKVMPFGTQAEVEAQVKTRLRELGEGGGYVVCAVHNIQSEVPAENIVAMCRATREHGRYPLN